MADLPADNYVNDNARTEGEMKQALEDFRDIFAQMIGGGLGEETLSISGGSISPTRAALLVDTEGGAPSDDLDTIVGTSLPSGSALIVRMANNSNFVTLKHGVGANALFNNSYGDILLTGGSDRAVYLRTPGGQWALWFLTRDLPANTRSDLGLGGAALATEGSGNGLDADTVDGLEAAAFLLAGATAADSTELVGINGANYFRKDGAAGAQIGATLWRNDFGQIVVRDNGAVNPAFQLEANSIRRARLDWAADILSLQGYAVDGTTQVSGLRARASDLSPQYYHDTDTSWYDLATQAGLVATTRGVGSQIEEYAAGNIPFPAGVRDVVVVALRLPLTLPTGLSSVRCRVTAYGSGTSGDEGHFKIYLGPTGNESDTLLHQGPTVVDPVYQAGPVNLPQEGGVMFDWDTGGHYVSLVFRKTLAQSQGPGGLHWSPGYLHVEFLTGPNFL